MRDQIKIEVLFIIESWILFVNFAFETSVLVSDSIHPWCHLVEVFLVFIVRFHQLIILQFKLSQLNFEFSFRRLQLSDDFIFFELGFDEIQFKFFLILRERVLSLLQFSLSLFQVSFELHIFSVN